MAEKINKNKDLNNDGVVSMEEELVAAQEAVEAGEIQAQEVVEALEPVVEAQPEVAPTEVVAPAVESTEEVAKVEEKPEVVAPVEAPSDVIKEEVVGTIPASSSVKSNGGSNVVINTPEIRIVKPTGSFLM